MASEVNNSDGHDWSVAASKYASTVGRSSAEAGQLLVGMASSQRKITSSSRILDVGAGTGAITLAAVDHCPEAQILATDYSQPMLDILKTNIPQRSGLDLKTQVLDANGIRKAFSPNAFSHVLSNFVLQTATTDPCSVVQQMYDVLDSEGVVGIGVWGKGIDPYIIWEEACRSLDTSFEMPEPFEDVHAWRTPQELKAGLEQANFSNVQVVSRRLPFPFPSSEAYAQFWYGGKNPGAQIVIDAWKGDPLEVKNALKKVVDTKYDHGKEIGIEGVLAVGVKQ